MWLFESDIDTEGIKEYKKDIEKIHIKCIVKDMAMNYLNNSDEEKSLIKYRIENILNTCKETEVISILVSLVTFIIGIFLDGMNSVIFDKSIIFDKFIIFGLLAIVYFIIMCYLVCSYRYFKVCKLYLKVIEGVEQGKIELKIDSNNNKYIVLS